ncbi:MAG: methoxymalonyl-ACP biosynthesis protein FkbH [Deltaproteobacteria bacterium]|nr:methoxymalonyl-ACP biosynthesis protein FkbH [Deltaproteobacteria bacterium]
MKDASELIDQFANRRGGDPDVWKELQAWMKAELQTDDAGALQAAFPRLVIPGLDYTTAVSLQRTLKRLRAKIKHTGQAPKLAILGGYTTAPLAGLVELYLSAGQVAPIVYQSDYGTWRQEVLDPDSELYRFAPDFLIITGTWRDAGHVPSLLDSPELVAEKVQAEVGDWQELWRIANERLGCQIIQCNFALPPARPLGNHDARHAAGFGRYLARVNDGLQDAAGPNVTVHDVDSLAANVGRWEWHDERFYNQAKLPCAPECLTEYAHSLASLVLAQLGHSRKCLVLDLDNTLWGGVIGDDGLGGIQLGQGEPEGEAFIAFQRYARALRERGVLLAVCSKNTESIAKEVFEKHTEMVLRLDDISCFMANWDDKATNMSRIAAQLNIGLNSLVFVDDNPVERAIVRQLCPEVAVPEMDKDPANYIRDVDRHRYFQAVSLSPEDLKRTEFYQASDARRALETSASDLNGFLKSLELVATLDHVQPMNLERCAQLINRSNQFNLTTRRYSAAELSALSKDPHWFTRTVSLSDRFGDSGLISVVLARIEDDSMLIDTWLMSCRVMKRGVEDFVLNDLVRVATERGLTRLLGEYRPTEKNGMVSQHYENLGFEARGENEPGVTRWELSLTAPLTPKPNQIQEVRIVGH